MTEPNPTPQRPPTSTPPAVRERATELCASLDVALALDDWDGVAALAGRLQLVAATQTRANAST